MAGEPGIAGATVNLFASDGTTLLATTATSGSGLYNFAGLPDGNYVVKVVPARCRPATPAPGKAMHPAVAYATTPSLPPWPVERANNTSTSATSRQRSGVSAVDRQGVQRHQRQWFLARGRAWDFRRHGDPVQRLQRRDIRHRLRLVVGSAITDVNGDYSFPGIADGSYEIRVSIATLPLAADLETGEGDAPGSACASAACDSRVPVTVSGANPTAEVLRLPFDRRPASSAARSAAAPERYPARAAN